LRGKYWLEYDPRSDRIVAEIKMGKAVRQRIRRSRAKFMDAKIMAMQFNSNAVLIAVCNSIPILIYIGMRMKAAPTPAIVNTLVAASVTNPANNSIIKPSAPFY
ncbi:MAG TPA: hypothetical protein PKC27_03145, partial [Methanomethylovorans sp.]|nr:hypothetical protein [Methanomethylovorans sp.]